MRKREAGEVGPVGYHVAPTSAREQIASTGLRPSSFVFHSRGDARDWRKRFGGDIHIVDLRNKTLHEDPEEAEAAASLGGMASQVVEGVAPSRVRTRIYKAMQTNPAAVAQIKDARANNMGALRPKTVVRVKPTSMGAVAQGSGVRIIKSEGGFNHRHLAPPLNIMKHLHDSHGWRDEDFDRAVQAEPTESPAEFEATLRHHHVISHVKSNPVDHGSADVPDALPDDIRDMRLDKSEGVAGCYRCPDANDPERGEEASESIKKITAHPGPGCNQTKASIGEFAHHIKHCNRGTHSGLIVPSGKVALRYGYANHANIIEDAHSKHGYGSLVEHHGVVRVSGPGPSRGMGVEFYGNSRKARENARDVGTYSSAIGHEPNWTCNSHHDRLRNGYGLDSLNEHLDAHDNEMYRSKGRWEYSPDYSRSGVDSMEKVSPRDFVQGEHGAFIHPSGAIHVFDPAMTHAEAIGAHGGKYRTGVDAEGGALRAGIMGARSDRQTDALGAYRHKEFFVDAEHGATPEQHATVRGVARRALREGHDFSWHCPDHSLNGSGVQSYEEHFGLNKSRGFWLRLNVPGFEGRPVSLKRTKRGLAFKKGMKTTSDCAYCDQPATHLGQHPYNGRILGFCPEHHKEYGFSFNSRPRQDRPNGPRRIYHDHGVGRHFHDVNDAGEITYSDHPHGSGQTYSGHVEDVLRGKKVPARGQRLYDAMTRLANDPAVQPGERANALAMRDRARTLKSMRTVVLVKSIGDWGERTYSSRERADIESLPHSESHVNAITDYYHQHVTHSDWAAGEAWHRGAQQTINERVGGTPIHHEGIQIGHAPTREHVAQALGAMSPRVGWGIGAFMADRVHHREMVGNQDNTGIGLHNSVRRARGALRGEGLGSGKSGRKTRALANATAIPHAPHTDHTACDRELPIDVHMDRVLHYRRTRNHTYDKITGKTHEEHSNAIRVAASRLGKEPHALHFASWMSMRRRMHAKGSSGVRAAMGAEDHAGQPNVLRHTKLWPGSKGAPKLLMNSKARLGYLEKGAGRPSSRGISGSITTTMPKRQQGGTE